MHSTVQRPPASAASASVSTSYTPVIVQPRSRRVDRARSHESLAHPSLVPQASCPAPRTVCAVYPGRGHSGSPMPLGPSPWAVRGREYRSAGLQPAGSKDSADALMPANQPDLLGKTAMVKFHLKYKTSFGQGVKLLGSHPRLGSWNLKDSVELRWTAGDQWVATVPLPAGGVYEYKYVLIDYETKKALEWQMGSNAVLAVVVSETDVNVYDNWGNNPGAMVQVDEDSMTRETKLQRWATEMMGYWKEARRLQIELVQKNNESQGLRNELAQLRMELSLERQNKLAAEAQITELQVENSGLKAQLVQKTVELNNTLAEVLQLLDKELEEDEGYYDEYESDGMDHDDGGLDQEEEEEEVDDEPPPRFMSGSYGDMLRNLPLAARTAASRNGTR